MHDKMLASTVCEEILSYIHPPPTYTHEDAFGSAASPTPLRPHPLLSAPAPDPHRLLSALCSLLSALCSLLSAPPPPLDYNGGRTRVKAISAGEVL